MRKEQDMLTLPSPAKLNLFLHILGQRNDGYHDLQTLFQLIDFSDSMQFYLRDDSEIALQVQGCEIPLEENLVYKAAKLLQEKADGKQGVDIELTKVIPMGAGLGGGSSNAATTLLALDNLWDLHLSKHELHELALKLGADVPVFVHGHSAWAEGIGDQLTPMILPEQWYLLLFVPCHIDTKQIFNDPRLTRDSEVLTMNHYYAKTGHNDFETLVRMDYSEVANALDWLQHRVKASMSGTGSTVFAAFDTREEAGRIASQVPVKFKTAVAKGVNHSPLQIALQNY